ncbi:MAG: VOC family protein [Gammaproteobacteria bacterium]|nr:VOC family protein [Gammaproteobacteria bacterium]NND54195.1 VOC family protein [Gammaproteobacteria bacterium]
MNNTQDARSVPVSAVIISVADLDQSLEFYAGILGLDVTDSGTLAGADFESYWQVPAGTTARYSFLASGADPVGRIQLLQFSGDQRKQIRKAGVKRAIGLFNLNIYTSDVKRDYEQLSAQGYEFWSEPNHINFGPAVGEAMEFAFEGPDGVVINLVELLSKDEESMIGHLWHFVNGYGRTPTGFTPVATTAHTVADIDKALAFYFGPLGMTTFSDGVIENEAANRMANLPADARTRSVLVQGSHEYGKIALAAPMNYEVASLVPDAVAPNIGYIAQAFEVEDLQAIAAACAEQGAEVFTAPVEIALPGRGVCMAMIVRNPGSGALQELFQVRS